jgi:hypothetical protein
VINWILANRAWLFSGIGLWFLGVLPWGYGRWRETRRTEAPDPRSQTSYEQVRSRPVPNRLPGFLLRALYKPEDISSRVKIALLDNAPGGLYLGSQIPSVDLNFQITNLSAIDLVLDRLLVDVWFGQPTFGAALLHRYIIPAGEITQGVHIRQMLSDNQKAQVAAFEAANGSAGGLSIYVTAYFESKLGRIFVQQTIERRKL